MLKLCGSPSGSDALDAQGELRLNATIPDVHPRFLTFGPDATLDVRHCQSITARVPATQLTPYPLSVLYDMELMALLDQYAV
jgi:hypothetical protein